MNKLYAFCTLVFLTACGSSGIDGSWSDVENADLGIEITGDKATLTERTMSITCPINEGDQGIYFVNCNELDGGTVNLWLRLDDGILKVLVDDPAAIGFSWNDARTFVRK